LLKELPVGITKERVIVDHYWIGTSMRLRMIQDAGEVAYKLCQKVRLDVDNPESVKITNIYLSEGDFHALAVTPASIVSKSRWTLDANGVTYAIDEFKGRHAGLVLAETEIGDGDAQVPGPEFALSEVTNANEYSGGWLAAASPEDLRRVIPR
jgi:CYTH domain-containing protein